MVYLMNETGEFEQAVARRWTQLMSEGPDLLIVEEESFGSSLAMQQIVHSLEENVHFDGLVAMWIGRERFLSGGIRRAYQCQGSSLPTYHLKAERNKLANALKDCKASERERVRKTIIISDELTMRWSFVFDMERNMSSKTASQHFHQVRFGLQPNHMR